METGPRGVESKEFGPRGTTSKVNAASNDSEIKLYIISDMALSIVKSRNASNDGKGQVVVNKTSFELTVRLEFGTDSRFLRRRYVWTEKSFEMYSSRGAGTTKEFQEIYQIPVQIDDFYAMALVLANSVK